MSTFEHHSAPLMSSLAGLSLSDLVPSLVADGRQSLHFAGAPSSLADVTVPATFDTRPTKKPKKRRGKPRPTGKMAKEAKRPGTGKKQAIIRPCRACGLRLRDDDMSRHRKYSCKLLPNKKFKCECGHFLSRKDALKRHQGSCDLYQYLMETSDGPYSVQRQYPPSPSDAASLTTESTASSPTSSVDFNFPWFAPQPPAQNIQTWIEPTTCLPYGSMGSNVDYDNRGTIFDMAYTVNEEFATAPSMAYTYSTQSTIPGTLGTDMPTEHTGFGQYMQDGIYNLAMWRPYSTYPFMPIEQPFPYGAYTPAPLENEHGFDAFLY